LGNEIRVCRLILYRIDVARRKILLVDVYPTGLGVRRAFDRDIEKDRPWEDCKSLGTKFAIYHAYIMDIFARYLLPSLPPRIYITSVPR
jgi:hypothetical protein